MEIHTQKPTLVSGANMIKTIVLLLFFSLCISYLWAKDTEREKVYYRLIPMSSYSK